MGRNKVPKLSWHPPAELGEWAREEAARRGGRGALSHLLTEALDAYRAFDVDAAECSCSCSTCSGCLGVNAAGDDGPCYP